MVDGAARGALVRVVIVVVAVAMVLGAGGLMFRAWQSTPEPVPALPIMGMVPPFDLVDENGETVSRDSLLGRTWAAAFVFTRCRGQCPGMIANLQGLQNLVGEGAGLQIVAITVDPEHDTPAVLGDYATRVGAEPEEWTFLTGPRDSIYQLARNGFLLGVEDASEVGEASPEEPILHSQRVVLIDAAGRIRGYYRGLSLEEMGRLASDARRLQTATIEPASLR